MLSYFLFMFIISFSLLFSFFFFNDTATTEIYTLSLHDALPISCVLISRCGAVRAVRVRRTSTFNQHSDRKSTRLNSSHLVISYAVFCLKKKKKNSRRDYLLIHIYEVRSHM